MPPDLPRFVPTLTEVVLPGETVSVPAPFPVATSPSVSLPALPEEDRSVGDELAEQLAHRVLQRIDAALEERLAEAVRSVVARHMQDLLPALREEIVMTVQATVTEALAEEFGSPDSTRNG